MYNIYYEPEGIYIYVYNIYNMVKAKKPIETAIAKSITIMPKHQRFIEAKSINLSKFVQKKLEEEMDEQGWRDG